MKTPPKLQCRVHRQGANHKEMAIRQKVIDRNFAQSNDIREDRGRLQTKWIDQARQPSKTRVKRAVTRRRSLRLSQRPKELGPDLTPFFTKIRKIIE